MKYEMFKALANDYIQDGTSIPLESEDLVTYQSLGHLLVYQYLRMEISCVKSAFDCFFATFNLTNNFVEKLKKLESKGNDSKTKKSSRGPSEKKRYSSPGPARSRRQRDSSGKQG